MSKSNKRRSQITYGKLDRDGFIHRSWMKNQGLPDDIFDGRPVVGICNTWSELTPCNAHLRDLADYVKRGVWEAGGFPVEFPAMSLGETQMRPTAMLYRNLLAMEVEESIRGNPIDGVVLLGGCDKTTPGQLLGAASVDLPTIVVSSGPMLNGQFEGKPLGSGTDVWRLSEQVRAGEISPETFFRAESAMSRSAGTCNTMGSASSFACLTESLGIALSGNGTLPAVDARRKTMAHLTGRAIVKLIEKDLKLSHFITREAMENTIKCHAAIGGSTNSVIHLLALSRRVGIPLKLQDFDELTTDIPLLVNLQPSGDYLMEEFHYAGGMPAVMRLISKSLDLSANTVADKPLANIVQEGNNFNTEVIRPLTDPVKVQSGAWVLSGNLCPNGAIIKPNAATPELLTHQGKAVVFESIEEFKEQVDDPHLEVDKDSILVLKGCGPKGYPGMPEVGNMPIPKKLLEQGVTDMVRISDARMSGTAYGTVILHVAPETQAGGPLAIVKTGDLISLDAPNRQLNLLIDNAEFNRRMQEITLPEIPSLYQRGYGRLYIEHVLQADEGCDLDFLVGKSDHRVTREAH